MAYTQQKLDDLQDMIAKGIKRGRVGGEEVEFRDLSEMERLETKMKRELGLTTGTRITYPSTSSGWR